MNALANPNAKILIYNTSDVLTHTITDDVLEASVSPSLTEQIGTFSFMLPGKKAHSYVYNDIGNNYTAKIYLGYGTLGAGDLQLVGKILRLDSTKSEKGGFYRVFSGKDLGEILERRLKTNRRYEDLDASTIVSVDIAAELGIYDAAKIETDGTDETVTIRTESFLNYLKKVSDYWYDGATKVQKDFYVDTVNKLVWKGRPHRTSGVETLTAAGINANILSYRLSYDITPVKNSVTVYGAPTSHYPTDKDTFTEALSGTYEDKAWDWELDTGTGLYLQEVLVKEGAKSIHGQNSTPGNVKFHLDMPKLTLRDISKLNFYYYSISNVGWAILTAKLYCPNSTNYFVTHSNLNIAVNTWHWADFPLGDSAVYDADENPTGVWDASGSPNWWNIQGLEFDCVFSSGGNADFIVDKLYFSPYRWFSKAENETSQTVYELREAEFTDDNLLSEAECQKRAETLALQLGDRVLALEVGLKGNTNVKIGDRVPVTLPADNVSAINFDVVSAVHHFQRKPLGLRTRASLICGADTRAFPPRTPVESVARSLQNLKAVTSELYSRVVR